MHAAVPRSDSQPVIVVGAGPVGAAPRPCCSPTSGFRSRCWNGYLQPHPLPRAVHLDDEVARVLDRIGVSEGFLARSRPGSGLRLLDARHRVMAEFSRDQQPSSTASRRPTCSTSLTWKSCCSPGSISTR